MLDWTATGHGKVKAGDITVALSSLSAVGEASRISIGVHNKPAFPPGPVYPINDVMCLQCYSTLPNVDSSVSGIGAEYSRHSLRALATRYLYGSTLCGGEILRDQAGS